MLILLPMYIFELKTQRRLVANIERRFPKLADLLPVLSVKKLRKKQAIDRCPKCLKIEKSPATTISDAGRLQAILSGAVAQIGHTQKLTFKIEFYAICLPASATAIRL
jgi:acetolactate synthase small subunit